ncbi:MAG: hypothetical protein IJ418_17070 [Clostridia bacterium]|nr:hypothetical protein [Clostridia bacterium]
MQAALATSSGYNYLNDPATGRPIAVNRATGEITGAHNVIVPDGTKILTPEDQERRQKFFDLKAERELRKRANAPLGHFIFMSGAGFNEISSASVARLVMLSTYCKYDDALVIGRSKPMTRAEAQQILGLEYTSFNKFMREVVPRFLVEKDGALYLANHQTFFRGRKDRKNHDQYWKTYLLAVRRLFNATDVRQHKALGRVFQLLPYINIEFNILAHDIEETTLDAVKPMTLFELCKELGVDWSHVNRLLALYRSLTFTVGDHQEKFVAIVSDGIDRRNARIFINPRILYSGSDYRRVEILGSFCKI